ncbi:MAG: helix-turn-helix domain-containing protein [Leptolyngbyaceae cyanobacterium]
MKQQSIAISTIVLDCGFANQTHLTEVFRQITGVTPKVYRKRCSKIQSEF